MMGSTAEDCLAPAPASSRMGLQLPGSGDCPGQTLGLAGLTALPLAACAWFPRFQAGVDAAPTKTHRPRRAPTTHPAPFP